MVMLLRTFVTQFLCLALVTADFAPPAQGQVPIGKAGVWVTLPFYAGRPAPESFRDAVRAGYSTSTDRRPVRSRQNPQPQLTNLPGQSSTVLPDGRLLLLGGEGKQGSVNGAAILDPVSSVITELPSSLLHARAWHSATLLPTGKVLVFGGVGSDDDVVTTAEVFDPATKQFTELSPLGLTPRAHHSATLLTDGTVFVGGGLDAHKQTLGTVQVWSPQTNSEINVDSQLISPRSDHTATLQADGTVLLWGGKNRVGLTLDYGEVYDPTAQSFRIQNAKLQTGQGVLTVAATIPGDGSESVPLNAVIAIRFSLPILMQSANNNTVTLTTGTQETNVSVVPAEAGMLLFVTPQDSLAADAEYTVELNGIVSTTGSSLAWIIHDFASEKRKGALKD